MERTIEEIWNDYDMMSINDVKPIHKDTFIELMQAYANQQTKLAVDKALQVASEKAYAYPVNYFRGNDSAEVDKNSILSLRKEILDTFAITD